MNERFNLDRPEAILGKRVIIELTTFDHNEQLLDQRQIFGEIQGVSETQGVSVRLIPSREEFILPPDLDLFHPLPAGPHRLEPSGEVIEGADLMIRSVIHNPPPAMQVEPLAKTTGGPPVRKA